MGDRSGGSSLLGNGYYLDLAGVHGAIVLRRDDGTEVHKFSVWDATSEAIERVAREDLRARRESSGAEGPNSPPTSRD